MARQGSRKGFGGCWQRHGGWKYREVSTVEREVVGYATCQDEGEECVEQWVDILEVQELGEEGKTLWVWQRDWDDGDLIRGFRGC